MAYAHSKGSGEPAHQHGVARTCAIRTHNWETFSVDDILKYFSYFSPENMI